jgi:hypothetical protein
MNHTPLCAICHEALTVTQHIADAPTLLEGFAWLNLEASHCCIPCHRNYNFGNHIYNVSYTLGYTDNGHCVSFTNKRTALRCVADLENEGATHIYYWEA